MKKIPILLTLLLLTSLFALTTQAFASPVVYGGPKKTPGPPNTPGAQATQNALTPPGNSQAGLHGKRENYRGTIAAVDSSTLTLTLGDDSTVTFTLTGNTRIKIPALQGGTYSNLQIGMTAMVQGIRDQNNFLVAVAIMVIPGKPTLAHRVGWVLAYTAGTSISIQASDGNTYTFTLTSDTKILLADNASGLAIGSYVTLIAPRDPSVLGWTATGIVVHPVAQSAFVTPTP